MSLSAGGSVQFVFGTSTQYEALKIADKVSPSDIYFLEDTQQIYLGTKLYNTQVLFVETFPELPSQGILYINKSTHETKAWNGSGWNVMIPPVSEILETATSDTSLVTAKAIRDYVTKVHNDAVTDISFARKEKKFTVTYGDNTTSELPLYDLLTGASYNSETGDFTFNVANAEPIVVNLPKENFLSTASFNKKTNLLTLKLVDGTSVKVDLVDLIDVYTAESTSTVELSIVENTVTASVKKSEMEGNILVLNEDGLFVPESLVKAVATSSTATLAVNGEGQLTAEVLISEELNNALVAKQDGLYVPVIDTYTKTEIDEALSLKANKDDVYDKTEVYNKEEVDDFTTWNVLS